jgi:formylglycine-generating enzyme required for sulfatase activity
MYDEIKAVSHVNENPRLLRGESFYDRPAIVRSADRYWDAPAFRMASYGFRLARTYP